MTGRLSPIGYVALLAASSLLHAWGAAGTYTLIAEQLPDDLRVTGNALVSTFTQAAVVIGPALAGGVATLVGPGRVIAADAASFAFLAVSCWAVAARSPEPRGVAETRTRADWRDVLRQPRLLGVLAVTCVFLFLYGPVEVALPIHGAGALHGSPGLLGAYWAAFGAGAVVGGPGAGLIQRHPLWTVVVSIVTGWGVALVPLGLADTAAPGLIGFAIGGVIYGPFTAITTALFQRTSPPHVVSRVLATRTALTTPATALGTLLGGPVVGAIGGRLTLLASGLLTIGLGMFVALVVAGSARAAAPGRERLASARERLRVGAPSDRGRVSCGGVGASPRAYGSR